MWGSGSTKKWLGIVLSVFLLAALLLYVRSQLEWKDVLATLANSAPWAIGSAVLLLWLNFAISTERYRLILRCMNLRRVGFGSLFRLTFLSFFLSHLIAIGPVADLVRVGYGRLRLNLPLVSVIESVVYDRVLAIAGISIFGLILLPLQIVRGVPNVLWWIQITIWISVLVGIILISRGVSAGKIQGSRFFAPIAESIAGFLPAVSGHGSVFKQIFLAISYSGSYGATIWVLARGMELNVDVLDIFQFSPLFLLVQSLPIFYVGWGARETVLVAVLSMCNLLPPEQALAVSVATGGVFLLASTPGAVVWLLRPTKSSPRS